jgi:hypothetical protein
LRLFYGPERVILDANGKQIAGVGTWGIQRADGSIDNETLARREPRRPTLGGNPATKITGTEVM